MPAPLLHQTTAAELQRDLDAQRLAHPNTWPTRTDMQRVEAQIDKLRLRVSQLETENTDLQARVNELEIKHEEPMSTTDQIYVNYYDSKYDP